MEKRVDKGAAPQEVCRNDNPGTGLLGDESLVFAFPRVVADEAAVAECDACRDEEDGNEEDAGNSA